MQSVNVNKIFSAIAAKILTRFTALVQQIYKVKNLDTKYFNFCKKKKTTLKLWICFVKLSRHLQTCNSIILVQIRLQQVINILSGCAQRSQTKAKGTTVTDNLNKEQTLN